MITQNIIWQIIIGICQIIGAAFLISIWNELIKTVNSSIKNEMMKINFNNVKYFIPTILSCFVLAFEIAFIKPYSKIDLIFIGIASSVIPSNFSVLWIIGNVQRLWNELVDRNAIADKMAELIAENNRLKADLEKLK